MVQVPLNRESLPETPITRTQKMYMDYHLSQIEQGATLGDLRGRGGGFGADQAAIDLVNTNNLMYTGPVFFGTPL